MNLTYFDAHSHLNFPQYDDDREEIISEMKREGFATICVGTNTETSKESVELARLHKNIWATVGLHPTDSGEFDSDIYGKMIADKVVGVGECGLDYFRGANQTAEDKKRQKDIFIKQIEFAIARNLPLMLHMRPSRGSMDAYEDGLAILGSYRSIYGEVVRGNSHFFVGSLDIAGKFLEMGFSVSFDGPITFTNDYDDIVRYVPEDMTLAETDAPFASPEPFRGRRNSPLYVRYVAERIAEIRGQNPKYTAEKLVANTARVFGLK